jgi:hypothetical protein
MYKLTVASVVGAMWSTTEFFNVNVKGLQLPQATNNLVYMALQYLRTPTFTYTQFSRRIVYSASISKF